jgi:hypothetical protein
MSQRTVPEVEQHNSPTFPPVQPYSIQIELPNSDFCHSLGLPTLHNSPEPDNPNLIAVGAESDNLNSIAVGAKRKSPSPSPSGSSRQGARNGKHWKGTTSPTGRRNLETKFDSVQTQTSSTVSTQTKQLVARRSPEAYYSADQTDYGHL